MNQEIFKIIEQIKPSLNVDKPFNRDYMTGRRRCTSIIEFNELQISS